MPLTCPWEDGRSTNAVQRRPSTGKAAHTLHKEDLQWERQHIRCARKALIGQGAPHKGCARERRQPMAMSCAGQPDRLAKRARRGPEGLAGGWTVPLAD